MFKVAYNGCFGGFSLSDRAVQRCAELGLETDTYPYDVPRHHPVLVRVIEELGDAANGRCASLGVAEVAGPYRIEEYDGSESVVEPSDLDWEDPSEPIEPEPEPLTSEAQSWLAFAEG
jgi:hypothetical protein